MKRAGVIAGLVVLAAAVPASAQAASSLGAAQSLEPQVSVGEALAAAKQQGLKPQKLRKARPAWFTRALERKVQRRGVIAAPADAPLPGEIGIRPGAWMIAPYWCTMNFIFQKRGTLAIGTAGHCLDGSNVTLLTLAPSSGIPVLVDLGKVVLRQDAGIGQDYGLVAIPPQHHQWVFPTIAGVGGPCGVFSGMSPQPVAHYGHGTVVGTGGTPRAGMGIHLANDPLRAELVWDNDSFAWVGLLAGGDSGSAVRVGTLGALGDLTHGIGLNVPGGDLPPSAIGWGTRVTTIVAKGWSVVNSPLCV